MTSQESNDEMTKLRAENEKLHQQVQEMEAKLQQQKDERLQEAIKQVKEVLTEKRHKETLQYMVENAVKKWPAEFEFASIEFLPPTNVSEAAKVEIGSYVENRWIKLEVPLAHLDRFLNEKTKRNVNICLKGLQVTEGIAETLMKIQLEEAPNLLLVGADLTPITNATLMQLLDKLNLWCFDDAVLPMDLDADALLEKRKGKSLQMTASGLIKDFFSFGIDALADFLNAPSRCLHIKDDHIQGSWYSLYEKLRDDFLADSVQRDYLYVHRHSKTSRVTTRSLTITKPATGERLILNCEPSEWNQRMERHVQSIYIERCLRPHEHIEEGGLLFG